MKTLIEAVERSEWTITHWRDFTAIPTGSGDTPGPILAHHAYHGNMNAALALHKAMLPGWGVELAISGDHSSALVFLDGWRDEYSENWVTLKGANPARTILLAILRALETRGLSE